MFTDLFPPRFRKPLYVLGFLAGVIVGAIQVAYLSIGHQPQWLDVLLAVYAFLGGSVHGLAGGNTDTSVPAVAKRAKAARQA